MISRLVASAPLLPNLSAKTKDAALKELLQVVQTSSGFPAKAMKGLSKKLSDREAMGSTGLGNSVAVPHVRTEDLAEPTLAVARIPAGLDWQAIDGRPVTIVFLLVSPVAEPETHLQCLRWISTLARNADFRRFLLDADDAAAMRAVLTEMAPGKSA